MADSTPYKKIIEFEWEKNKQIYADPKACEIEFKKILESLQYEIVITEEIPGTIVETDVRHRFENIKAIIIWVDGLLKKAKNEYFLEGGRGWKKQTNVKQFKYKNTAYDARCPNTLFDSGLPTISKVENIFSLSPPEFSKSPYSLLILDIMGIKNETDAFYVRKQVNNIDVEFKTYADLNDNTDSNVTGGSNLSTSEPSNLTLAMIEKRSVKYTIRPCLHLLNWQAAIASKNEFDNKLKIYDISGGNLGNEILINAIVYRLFNSTNISFHTLILYSKIIDRLPPNTIINMLADGTLLNDDNIQDIATEVHNLWIDNIDRSQLLKNIARAIAEQDNTSNRLMVNRLCSSSPILAPLKTDIDVVEKTYDMYRKGKIAAKAFIPVISYKIREVIITKNFIEGAWSSSESISHTLSTNNEIRTDSSNITNKRSEEIIEKKPLLRRKIVLKESSTPLLITVTVSDKGIIDRAVSRNSDENTIKTIKTISLKTANWEDCATIYNLLTSTYKSLGQRKGSFKLKGDSVKDKLISDLLDSQYDFSFSYQSDRYEANLEISALVTGIDPN